MSYEVRGFDIRVLKIFLFLIAFGLFLISGNAFLGLFENNPQFLIIEQVEAGARLYTGLSPVSVDNDGNVIALNILASSDWNGLLDGFEGADLNFTVLDACSGDANSVWTSANNCQSIVGFDTGGGGGDSNVTLDEAYDNEAGIIRRVRVDDEALIFDVNKATTGLPGIDLNINMS